MRASLMDDPLYDADDELSLQPEPMRPILIPYTSHPGERAVQRATLDALELVHVDIGQMLYAAGECDSNALRLQAAEQLAREGLGETFGTEPAITRRAEALLRDAVIAQAPLRSAVHEVSPQVARFAREQRAIADRELEARGVDMRSRIAGAVAGA